MVFDHHAVDPNLEQRAALVASAFKIVGLPPTFLKSYREYIVNGDLAGARTLVDCEIRQARALLDAISEFERSLGSD